MKRPSYSKKFSVIICLYVVDERFFKDLEKFSRLKYKNFEIILVCEKNTQLEPINKSIKIVKSKKDKISLGEKRDLGIRASSGEFCAFIDDDAYPDAGWLANALKIFNSDKKGKIGALGGPNLTPPDDSFFAQVGGYIYESYLTSGEIQYRFLPRSRREVDELQGVNLIIRKEVLKKVGGFNSRLYSGDDSKVCSAIRAAGYKVIYHPKVAVYHHRRPFPVAHLKQVRNMGKHRGFFVKAYPQTLAPLYFLPSFLTLGFFGGLFGSLFSKEVRIIFLSFFLIVFGVGFLSVYKRAGFLKSFFTSLGIILTHITYGISFLKGLTLESIERKEVPKYVHENE